MCEQYHQANQSVPDALRASEYLAMTGAMPSETVRMQLSVMGRRVIVEAPDPLLLAAVAQAYAVWLGAPAVEGRPIQIALETAAEKDLQGPAEVTVDGPRLALSGPGVEGWADAGSLEAFCRVPASLGTRPAELATEVVDTLLLFLLTRSGRIPLHAAGVMVGGTAVVLAGPSGTGKSTLSLAAMQRGLRILSDDTVYIQLQPSLRIWGFPRPLHVFPADAPRFTAGTRLRQGKLKAVVPLAADASLPVADRAVLVLLERGSAVGLRPAAREEALRALSRLEPGFDLLAEECAAAAAALADAGAWHLTLSSDPAEAIEALIAGFAAASAQIPPP